jgi:hypothetical protein
MVTYAYSNSQFRGCVVWLFLSKSVVECPLLQNLWNEMDRNPLIVSDEEFIYIPVCRCNFTPTVDASELKTCE